MKQLIFVLLAVVWVSASQAEPNVVTVKEIQHIKVSLKPSVSNATSLVQDGWPGVDFEDRRLIARKPIEPNVHGLPEGLTVNFYGAFEMCATQAISRFANKKRAQKETWAEYLWEREIDSRVSFVNGTLASGDEVFLFDTDNDEDFSDEVAETPQTFEMGRGVGGLRAKRRVAFDYVENGQIKTRSAVVEVYKFSQYIKPRKDPSFPKFRGMVREFLTGDLVVGGETFTVAIDNGGEYATYGTKIWNHLLVDLNRDGQLVNRSRSAECFPVNKPMKIKGTTLEVVDISASGDMLTLRVSDEVVEEKVELKSGVVAPSFEVATLDGTVLKLEDLKGKPVVLNFWAIGCSPCRAEIPGLNVLVKEFGDDVVFIAPALDKADALEKYLDKAPFNYQVVPNAKAWFDQYNLDAMPTHVIIGKDGVIQKIETGGGNGIDAFLRPLIAEAVDKAVATR